jgi:phosphopantetheinyl transferase
MAMVLSEKSNSYECYIWKIREEENWFADHLGLTNTEYDKITSWTKERRLEWLTGRYLLKEKGGLSIEDIQLTSSGKPFIEGTSSSFSISHSNSYVGIIKSSFQVGLDIQTFRKDISRISSKFMTKENFEIWPRDIDQLSKMHMTWCIKEAVFKAYGLGQINFKEDIIIHKCTSNNASYVLEVQLNKKDTSKSYKIITSKMGSLYKAIAIAE